MKRFGAALLFLGLPSLALAVPALRVPELPPLPPPPTFADDPVTDDKVALGTALFFDRRLSGSGHSSCASCHIPTTAFQDNLRKSTPDRSQPADHPTTNRNTPSLINLVYAPRFRWDGSHDDVLEVLTLPFAEENINVARLPRGDARIDVPAAQRALRRTLIVALPGYRRAFRDAFGVDIGALDAVAVWRLVGRALRAFAEQLVARDTAFDRWNAGDDGAMSPAAVRGLAVFRGRGRCIACHDGPLLSDFAFHNISSSPPGPDGRRADEGRFGVTGREEDRGAFLTPSLRGAWATSPYFHDGSHSGLRDVLAWFASDAVAADPNHDLLLGKRLPLDDADIDDLVELLRALRGSPPHVTPPTAFP